jgi:hypothetical protein
MAVNAKEQDTMVKFCLVMIALLGAALCGELLLTPLLVGPCQAPDSPRAAEDGGASPVLSSPEEPVVQREQVASARADEKVVPAAVLTLAQERAFVEGEPIELKLTITNTSDHEIEIWQKSPVFSKFVWGATLVFSRDGREVQPKPRPSPKGWRWAGGGKFRIITLAPSSKHEVPLFLQRYCPQPRAGKHELSYAIKIESPKLDDDDNPRAPHIAAEGKLAFTIEPRDEEKLQREYKTLGEELDQNHWRDRAEEALAVAEDPIAIPYLIQACERSRKYAPSDLGYSFFDALTRFPDNKEVRKFMADHISAGYEEYYTIEALDLLGDWKMELPKADVRRLLKSKGRQVDKATEDYIHKMAPKYDDLGK